MAKLAQLLALGLGPFVHGLPRHEAGPGLGRLDDLRITLSTDLPATTSYVSIPSLQQATPTESPSLTGSVVTGLPSMDFTRDPIQGPTVTQTPEPLQPIGYTLSPGPTSPLDTADGNIFTPKSQDPPPPQIESRDDHPVPKQMIVDQEKSIQTNKFYANFFLGSQTAPVWTHPYSLAWAKGYGNTYGMSISHIERSQLVFASGNPPEYFISPVGIQHIALSAKELGENTVLSTEELTGFSAYANLSPDANSEPVMSFPCVQGMGFVTALYNNAQPALSSGVFFRKIQYAGQVNGGTYKYRVALEDGSKWLLYVTPVASLGAPPFLLHDSRTLNGPEGFSGMIQVAKNPSNNTGEEAYDYASGTYATNATVSGTTNGPSGSYTIKWGKEGSPNHPLLMFALPHHVESFDDGTKSTMVDIQLSTTTKGYAQAVIANEITMVEPNLPDTIGFAPWVPATDGASGGSESINLDQSTLAMVNSVGASELNQDFDRQTRLDSMYYSGKGLAKYAAAIYSLQTLGRNSELAAAGLLKLKDAFNVFVNNTQPLPLVYDSVWGGVVSSGTYRNGDTGQDFGNTLYNDHHFHYGYFVWTAAVIGYLDSEWLTQGTNKAWVDMLVRDYANPSDSDPYFPFQRSFDWYHGHSWAKGLFESFDGKDQESTSEDTFSTYAIKMWGRISGDANMEARGNLQLAVQARSVQNYFLLTSDNKVQPENFLPNKVTGILFENKVDHTTYFGANIEFIQGIHMIPLNPSSAYVRTKKFVQEEWDAYFSNGRADQAFDGWKGILYANLALTDPITAYEYFADPNFNMAALDGGASRTWYLAYTAALMAGGGGEPVATVDANDEGTVPAETEEDSTNGDDEADVEEDPASADTPVPQDESASGEVQDESVQDEENMSDQPSWAMPSWYGDEDKSEEPPVESESTEASISEDQDESPEEQEESQEAPPEAGAMDSPSQDQSEEAENQDQESPFEPTTLDISTLEKQYENEGSHTEPEWTDPPSLYDQLQDEQFGEEEPAAPETQEEDTQTDDSDDNNNYSPKGEWVPGEEDFDWPQIQDNEAVREDESPETETYGALGKDERPETDTNTWGDYSSWAAFGPWRKGMNDPWSREASKTSVRGRRWSR